MRVSRPISRVFFQLLVFVGLALLYIHIAEAAPPNPSLGMATVDGNPGEWDLTNDFFADMYRAANTIKKVESKLYLRYDCSTNTLYALVLAVTGVPVVVDIAPTTPGDAYVKVHDAPSGNSPIVDGNSGDDGTPPDFQWVGLSGDGHYAEGWEASAPLAPGSYTKLNVHNNVFDDGEQQTSAVANREIALEITCGAPPGPTPLIKVLKRDSLSNDQNGNGKGNPGDVLLYTVTITNNGTETATGVTYSDTVDTNTSLICSGLDAPTASQGTISSCTSGPGGDLQVNVGDIAASGSVTITYKVEVLRGNFKTISNQGKTTGIDFTETLSDDPDTGASDDPTVTSVLDPTGYIYDETNGKIISGGKISVTGPGTVTIFYDGSDGFYQFATDGTPGTYTITLTLPPNYSLSTTCLPKDPPPFDPTGGPDPTVLGNDENGATGYLTSNACTDYYFTFDLAPGDPVILLNNFPLRQTLALVGGDPPIWGEIVVFPTPESALGRDLNGDGDTSDTILRYQNLDTGKLVNTGIPVSGAHRDVDIYEDTVVFVLQESSFLDFLGGIFNFLRSPLSAGPIGTYNLRTGKLQLTGVWGSRPTVYQNILSISGNTIRYYDLGTGKLTDTRIPGQAQALWGRQIAYHHAQSRDEPPMIHVYDLDTGRVIETHESGSFPAIYESLIAFTTQESWVGQDLNGDGDLGDTVLRYYDLRTQSVINTGEDGQDPAIHGGQIVFTNGSRIRYFDIENGYAYDTGKLGAEPDIYGDIITYYVWELLRGADLSGDGDQLDPIVETHQISKSDRMLPKKVTSPKTDTALSSPLKLLTVRVLGTQQANAVRFMVHGTGLASMEVEVYDLRGKRVFHSGITRGTSLLWNLTTRDGRRVANGIYLYAVTVRGIHGSVVRSYVQKLVVLR